MSAARRSLVAALVVATGLIAAPRAQAYSVEPGDLLLRPVMGASVNFLRYDVVTKETPKGGMILGLDFDYAIDGYWAVTGTVRPVFSPGFFDGDLGVGAKYRLLQTNAPFIPYASAMLVLAPGAPVRFGDLHLNLGVRAAVGVDYYVTRHIALGAEMAVSPTLLLTPALSPEISTEALWALTYRF